MTRLSALVVAGSILALASSASADEDGDKAGAAPHLKSAQTHFMAGRFEEALVEYEAAYKLDREPDTLFAIAQTERKLGRCHLALPHYREYLQTLGDFPDYIKPMVAECWMQLPQPEANKPCPKPGPTDDALPWYKNPASGAVVVGTLGLSTGIGFLIASSSSRDKADDAQFSDDFDRYLDEATGRRRIGVTFLITGALLAGGGIAYHYWTKPRTSRPTMAIATDGHSISFARSF